MNVWKVGNITQEPEVVLIQWSVLQLPCGDRHFVGWNLILGEGRVSSAIQEFDKTTLTGKTRSGRIYKLDGPSGHNNDAQYVWAAWCRINKVDRDTVILINEEFENGTL